MKNGRLSSGAAFIGNARTDAQLLQEALTVAQKADVIVAALGESSEMSGESSSRTDLNIPDVQQNLLKELLKTGKPVVLVLFTGRPLTLKLGTGACACHSECMVRR